MTYQVTPDTIVEVLEDNRVDVVTRCTFQCFIASNQDGIEAGDVPSSEELALRLVSAAEPFPVGMGYFLRAVR